MKGGQLPEEVRQAVASLSENRQQQRRSLLGRFEARLRDLARVQKDRVVLESRTHAAGEYRTQVFHPDHARRIQSLKTEEEALGKSLRDLYAALVAQEATTLTAVLPGMEREVPLLADTLAGLWCRNLARKANVSWTPARAKANLSRGAILEGDRQSGLLQYVDRLLQQVKSNPHDFLWIDDVDMGRASGDGKDCWPAETGFQGEVVLAIQRLEEVLAFLGSIRDHRDMEAHDALLDGSLGDLDFDE